MKKIAFAGLRHGHINSLYNEAANSAELEICAICEEDAAARQAFVDAHLDSKAPFYNSLAQMLAEVSCDIVAIGDYYGKRGSVAVAALSLLIPAVIPITMTISTIARTMKTPGFLTKIFVNSWEVPTIYAVNPLTTRAKVIHQ